MKKLFQKKYILAVSLVLACSSFASASDELFQNNLLKMDINRNPQGAVKVTLYTKKPYNDKIIVNKKGDKEYVILMPETANSLTAKPTLRTTSDVIQNVEVKTQQYIPGKGQKGYTKITFSTTKPIEITPSIQTIKSSDYLLSENDYKELMSQAGKKQPAKTTAPVKKEAQKTLTKPTVKPTAPVTATAAEKTATKTKTSTKLQPTGPAPRPQGRPETVQTAKYNPPKTVAAKAPEKVITTPVKSETVKTEPKIAQEKMFAPTQAETEAGISTPVKTIEQPTATNTTVSETELQTPTVSTLQKIKNMINSNLYMALGLILIPLILIILLLRSARNTVKRMNEQKEAFASHLDEQPLPVTDYEEQINEEMDWKEKFKTYTDTKSSQEEEGEEPAIAENKDLDNLFTEEAYDPTEESAETESFEETYTEEFIEEESDADEILNEISALDALEELEGIDSAPQEYDVDIDDIFGNDEEGIEDDEEQTFPEQGLESFVNTYEQPSEEAEEDNIVQSHFSIDSEKSFYLVDFENTTALVGQIDEEIFVLKRFDEQVSGQLQARLNEKKGSASIYMVKSGGFKALVEVTSDNMKLLIEL